MPLPTAEEEVWRYSRIGELQLDRFNPTASSTTVTGANGYLADRHDVDTSTVHDVFDELNAAFHGDDDRLRSRGACTSPRPIMVTHTTGGHDEATFPRLVIDAGEDSEVTVVERFMSTGGDAALLVPRLFVRARAGGAGHLRGDQRARHRGVAARPPAGGG